MYLKIGVHKNFAIFTEKHLRWSLSLIMLRAFRSATKNNFNYRKPPVAASENRFSVVTLLFLIDIDLLFS